MNLKRRILTAALSAAAAAVLMAPQASASGSVEDIYNAMRGIGLPESMIQEARNQFAATEHDADGMTVEGRYFTYDVWADMVYIYEDDIWEKVGEEFGVSGSEIKEQKQTNAPPSESGGTTTTTTVQTTQPSIVTQKPFTSMTLDEKKAYVASLPENERAAFLSGLSNSERNSIIKQMSTDKKAELVQGFADLGEQLGMHITVDQIDGNNISFSVRDGEGTLIDSTGVGTVVDDTGWNTAVPVLLSSAAILSAAGGFVWLSLRGRKERQAAE